MSPRLVLQAGGALNPRRHVYIERPEDADLLRLLRAGEYVNVLTPRQMGKSSLMVRMLFALNKEGVRTASIDLAAELGSETEAEAWFKGLVGKLARELSLALDVGTWWQEHAGDTAGQRLQRFFREAAGAEIPSPTPIVIFLDEIDSTLRHVFTDGLFTAIRGMYNERGLVPAYEQVTFCLLGVATPNELIKDRRTTAYNVGRTLSLRDFDATRDDLTPLVHGLAVEPAAGQALLARILHWTGGQPYLTVKLVADLRAEKATAPAAVDTRIERTFASLDGLREEIHFQQILRFVETRLGQGLKSLEIYRRVLTGQPVRAETTPAHLELELSGLVQRDATGHLVLRNPIYTRLFDRRWLATTQPMRTVARYRRRIRYGVVALAASLLVAAYLGYSYWREQRLASEQTQIAHEQTQIAHEQTQIAQGFETLASREVTITGDAQSGFELKFPNKAPQALLQEALAAIPNRGAIRSLDLTDTQVADLAPLAGFTGLQRLNLWDTQVADLAPLAGLTGLQRLDLSDTQVTDLAPLAGLTGLQRLDLSDTQVTDLTPLAGLTGLQGLDLSETQVTDLTPLAGLTGLQELSLAATTQVTDLTPLAGLTGLQWLDLTGTQVTDLTPLASLTSLEILALANTSINEAAIVELRQKLTPPHGKLRALGKQTFHELKGMPSSTE